MGVYENARKATKEAIVRAFWQMYQEQPINKITVKELMDSLGLHRGTFYIHFTDTYAVLEEIEAYLLEDLESIDTMFENSSGGLAMYSQILYNCFQTKKEYLRLLVLDRRDPFFAQKYVSHLKEHMLNICLTEQWGDLSEKELSVLDITVSTIVYVLLYSICNSCLTIDEINELIAGFIQNGCFVTVTNKFNIHKLNNPFNSEFWG